MYKKTFLIYNFNIKSIKYNKKRFNSCIFYDYIVIGYGKGVDTMAKKEEKNKVGRPKLASPELIKDSWCKIGVSIVFIFVFLLCGIGNLTTRTPFEVLTFQNPNKMSASVLNSDDKTVVIPANKVEVIYPEDAPKRIINTDGIITRIIPIS